ncbi:hypothetical protein K469DRAFT_699849 [Zopfia rhizophila CBS 207.26]|uniref:Uncharacterized protein n=1 Tax=Zopfia rhizophila CBS 207.26 TaxID=1314779 RepID=A0A6A6EES6_9PEZI|nr:hypothetical protein K469DRAFT_699849 [Zopfia rhizophila CBS 207.26]
MVAQSDSDQITHPFYVARQSTQIGGAAGITGVLFGAVAGTLHSQTPVIWSIASGAQWLAIGTTFWATRTSILNRDGLLNWWSLTRGAPLRPRTDLTTTPQDKVYASSVSGTVTGVSLGLIFRGPRNVIPGAIMFTLFGFGGQHAYNYLDRRNTEEVQKSKEEIEKEKRVETEKGNWLQRMGRSKWSPMTVLTDEEYEKMLQNKLLAVEADIALIDEKIEKFQKQQKVQERTQVQEKGQEKK